MFMWILQWNICVSLERQPINVHGRTSHFMTIEIWLSVITSRDSFDNMVNLKSWQGFIITVLCHYNAINFFLNFHKIHPIAGPLGWAMGCILWVKTIFYTMPQSQQWCMPYHVIADLVITALNCMYHNLCVMYYTSLDFNGSLVNSTLSLTLDG